MSKEQSKSQEQGSTQRAVRVLEVVPNRSFQKACATLPRTMVRRTLILVPTIRRASVGSKLPRCSVPQSSDFARQPADS
eukprot:scaffold721_cov235-Pinguiococcus_pyrenoidosus.AAC.1